MATCTRVPTTQPNFHHSGDFYPFRYASTLAPPPPDEPDMPRYTIALRGHLAYHIQEGQLDNRDFRDYHFCRALLQTTTPTSPANVWEELLGDGCIRVYINKAYGVTGEKLKEKKKPYQQQDSGYAETTPTPPPSPPPSSPIPDVDYPYNLPPYPVVPTTSVFLPKGIFDPQHYILSIEHLLTPLTDEAVQRFGKTFSTPNLLASFRRVCEEAIHQFNLLRYMYGTTGNHVEYQIGVVYLSFKLYEGVLSMADKMADLRRNREYFYTRRENMLNRMWAVKRARDDVSMSD
ncbi:hypothetical protein JAAARDRAFT_188449 [Jaapia argillacea MUCL 33604]|uniref:Uncharacterized protein n=1 Tax=Jaapia argillacea MUCL 33604 TaxID=933084 RepID=A0A067QE15_9AGAM|nr:hypothetical protein JAAARDRAFT_188449 [Jaapia argillacea MUCL 33604]